MNTHTKWAIQDEATGEFVEYLGKVTRLGARPQTWETYLDAITALASQHRSLNDSCRIVDVTGMETTKAEDLARSAARTAHEEDFSTHWGSVEHAPALVLYDNHPNDARASNVEAFKAWLAEHAYVLLGEASYPTSGEDEGYTLAFVISNIDDKSPAIRDAYQRLVAKAASK